VRIFVDNGEDQTIPPACLTPARALHVFLEALVGIRNESVPLRVGTIHFAPEAESTKNVSILSTLHRKVNMMKTDKYYLKSWLL
jgi:hypothetical protein